MIYKILVKPIVSNNINLLNYSNPKDGDVFYIDIDKRLFCCKFIEMTYPIGIPIPDTVGVNIGGNVINIESKTPNEMNNFYNDVIYLIGYICKIHWEIIE